MTRQYGAIIAESETAFPVDKRKGEKNNTNITIFSKGFYQAGNGFYAHTSMIPCLFFFFNSRQSLSIWADLTPEGVS